MVPAFGASAWAPAGFGSSVWPASASGDLALGKIQLQATHNVALQVPSLSLDNTE